MNGRNNALWRRAVAAAVALSLAAGAALPGTPVFGLLGNSSITASAADDEVSVNTWDGMKAALSKGEKILLSEDITAPDENSTLESTGTSILNLNGHTIKGGGARVIDVNAGTLTIKDTGSGGKITGGTRLGGIYVKSGAGLVLQSGSISGNKSLDSNFGGGITADGTVTIDGGSISGNIADVGDSQFLSHGGGIYARKGSKITVNGGVIELNKALNDRIDPSFPKSGGGGICVSEAECTITGGEIRSNNAQTGGGICLYNKATVTMTNGVISGNTAYGGAIGGAGVSFYGTDGQNTFNMYGGTISANINTYVTAAGVKGAGVSVINTDSTFNVKGQVYIYNNVCWTAASGSSKRNSDVDVHSGGLVTIVGALNSGSTIGLDIDGSDITTDKNYYPKTSGWSTYMGQTGVSGFFVSNVANCKADLKNGEVVLVKGTEDETMHKVEVSSTSGHVIVTPDLAAAGALITISAEPGWKLSGKPTGTYLNSKGQSVDFSNGITTSDGGKTYTFTMKNGDCTIKAEAVEDDTPSTYSITTDYNSTNATLTVTPSSLEASEGDTVTFTATAKSGQEIDEITVTGKSGAVIAYSKNANGSYSFDMPAEDVTIKVTTKAATAHSITLEKDSGFGDKGLSVRPTSASKGTAVKFNVKPLSGKEVDTITVTGKSGTEIPYEFVETLSSGYDQYTFEMPDEDVTISVTSKDIAGASSLYGLSVSIEGDVGLNYYMKLSNDALASTATKMVFTYEKVTSSGTKTTVTQEVPLSKAVKRTIDNVDYYGFKCNVPAKEMATDINASLYDGSTEVCKLDKHTVKEYGEKMISEPAKYGFTADSKEIKLIKAMLNYGGYSQTYFGRLTYSLANSSLTADEKDVSNVAVSQDTYKYTGNTSLCGGKVTFYSASLKLESDTAMQLFFLSDSKITFNVAGADYTVEERTSGGQKYQVVSITGIKPWQLPDKFKVTVTAGGSSDTVEYAPAYYCATALASTSVNAKLQDVIRALWKFSQAAIDYKTK